MSNRIKSLETIVKKKILLLNNDLPDDLGEYWLTVDELRERLIYSGVSSSLDVSLVISALQHFNRGELLMKRWDYQGIAYYRSMLAHLSDKSNIVPLQQRWKMKGGRTLRVGYNPDRDYFVGRGNAKFEAVNDALDEIENEREEIRRREKEERERLKSEPLFSNVLLLTSPLR